MNRFLHPARFALLLLSLIISSAHGQILITPTTWTGHGASVAGPSAFPVLPATTLPGAATVAVSQWNREALTNTAAGGCYNSNGWLVGGTLAGAIAGNRDIFFTITNAATTQLQVTRLFIMSQVSATGPHNVQVRYTVGSTTGDFGSTIATAHTATPENWTIDDTICIGPGQTATFRIYGWGATTAAGTLRINNGTAITAYFADPVTVSATSNSPVCAGDSVKFTGTGGGGIGPYTYSWSGPASFASTEQNPAIAGATAAAAGVYTLTVTDALQCSTLTGSGTTAVAITPAPGAITGTASTCEGSTTTLSSATTGGTWSSSDVSTATVGLTSGIVTGITAGTATITYTGPTGCRRITIVTVNVQPPAISGIAFVCISLTTALSNIVAGGTWSSSNAAVASVGASTGIVTGNTAGTATITYTLPSGCMTTRMVTVSALPSAITGPGTLCPGTQITLSNTATGGTWSSSNTGVATASASTGIITGVAAGTATITYTVGVGCRTSRTVTVNPLPAPITGTLVVCEGFVTLLGNTTPAGTWSSSNPAVATVGFTGGVIGVSGGTTTISYTLATSCARTVVVTVNPAPAPISGPAGVCLGSTATLSSASAGGTWSSSNIAVSPINASAIVTGLSLGTATITYRLPTNCYTTRMQTVNPLPTPIAGPAFVCANGGTITLSSTPTGGSWSSSDPATAAAAPGTGVITGVLPGTVTITYTLPTGCMVTTAVSVHPAPPASIVPLGDTTVCPGTFVALTANTGTGLTYQWFRGSAAIPFAGSATFIATTTASYRVRVTNSLGCPSFSIPMLVTIDTPVAIITSPGGVLYACSGAGVLLNANTATGLLYQWQIGSTPITGATASSYNATSSGGYIVFVTTSTGCQASDTAEVTINPSPSALISSSGPLTFCHGDSVRLTAATGSGYLYQWHSVSGAILGATSSVYTARVSGSYWVTITNSLGCSTTTAATAVTALPLPAAGIAASGPLTFCTGGSVTLTASSATGLTYQWFRNGSAIAGATAVNYLATTGGLYRVQVTNGATGCTARTAADTIVTVITSPAIIPLTPPTFCWGGSSVLSTTVSGAPLVQYRWSRNGIPIAGATSGNYTASAAGDYTVEVIVPLSCTTTTAAITVTEKPLPAPVVNYNSTSHVLNTQSYFVTYQWYKDLAIIPGATAASTVATGPGSYKVAVTDTNGCQSFSASFPLTGWSGGGGAGVSSVGQTKATDINIYPNPVTNTLVIEMPAGCSAALTTVDGMTIIPATNTPVHSISDLAAGIYIVHIYNSEGQRIKFEKLVKAQ